jgi:D-alanyl-D-alanine-carboxypeptidase/D-alanyl-D-alanine-endopeptidase
MKRGCLPALLLLFFLNQVHAQTVRDIVDRYALPFIHQPKHVGMSIGILINGVSYTYHYGFANKETRQAPTAQTIYEIASVTKSFTGILLAHAVLEKKIGLEDDIHRYLPGPFPNLTYAGHPVRIVDLANHTAGFPKFILPIPPGSTPDQMNAIYAHEDSAAFYEALAKIKLDTVPGVRYAYSNADAELLGAILAGIYHASYGDLVRGYITGSAGMSDTRLIVPDRDRLREATGYDLKGRPMPEAVIFRRFPGAGSLSSTVADMEKYLRLNLNNKDAATQLAHQPTLLHTDERGDDIGLYWYSHRLSDGSRLVRHAGGSFGCTSYCAICPEEHLGIVVLANDACPGTEAELVQLSNEIMTGIQQQKPGTAK